MVIKNFIGRSRILFFVFFILFSNTSCQLTDSNPQEKMSIKSDSIAIKKWFDEYEKNTERFKELRDIWVYTVKGDNTGIVKNLIKEQLCKYNVNITAQDQASLVDEAYGQMYERREIYDKHSMVEDGKAIGPELIFYSEVKRIKKRFKTSTYFKGDIIDLEKRANSFVYEAYGESYLLPGVKDILTVSGVLLVTLVFSFFLLKADYFFGDSDKKKTRRKTLFLFLLIFFLVLIYYFVFSLE